MTAPRTDLIIGTPHDVHTALRTLHGRGQLLGYTPRALADGRIAVRVQLAPPRRRRWRHRRPLLVAAAIASVVAALTAIGLALVWLVGELLLLLPVLLGAVAVAVIAGIFLRPRSCPGLHCSGCGH